MASELKPSLNGEIVRDILENLGYEFNRNKQFRLRDERTPSASIRIDGFIKDFGSGWSGDIFDLLKDYHDMDLNAAVEYVASYLGVSDSSLEVKKATQYKPYKEENRPPDDYLIKRLEIEANRLLNADIPIIGSLDELPCNSCIKRKAKVWSIEIVKNGKSEIRTAIPNVFRKLFEGSDLKADLKMAKYVFKNIVGFSEYFNCPAIIIRDSKNRVVDIAYYRPIREDRELPKYLYKANDKKPLNRGKYFLYPFQIDMERLMKKKSYVVVGEGLKNAVNALIYETPYISLEGAANKPKDELAEYVKKLEKEGKVIYTAFDGDKAGKSAYEAFNRAIQRDYKPLFGFDSGYDFTTYCKEHLQ